jgi:hypothetical protein
LRSATRRACQSPGRARSSRVRSDSVSTSVGGSEIDPWNLTSCGLASPSSHALIRVLAYLPDASLTTVEGADHRYTDDTAWNAMANELVSFLSASSASETTNQRAERTRLHELQTWWPVPAPNDRGANRMDGGPLDWTAISMRRR